MVKIKIISNPYQKVTTFQSWNEATKQWILIDQYNNADSQLLHEEFCVGFFPFKAQQIVDVIIQEYSADSEKIEIIFEGTDDEYMELASICKQAAYCEKICLSKSKKYLENARDILPDIINIFKKLSPLMAESVSDETKIKRDLDKFSDASNDVIPICIIGNYSSGKSTFINALIGYELLPSSDEPTTAKVYKISQSKHPDRAEIKFEYSSKPVHILFSEDSSEFLTDPEDNALTKQLKTRLEEIDEEPIPSKLNKVMEVINSFANMEKDEAISDLIELEAPFYDNGIWGKMWNNFVIFDTPGSNSASNVKHYQVLKKAMEDLSNGLPIFVSEYDSLDSTDNDKLYHDINNMEELDKRFTMIIVNKADAASLKKGFTVDDHERILSLAIPRKLYSGGLYFVSSIMGLGSKNDGEFIAEHNAEIFADQKNKYIDPASRLYKQLYRYNILPAQIKRKYDMLAEKHKNLLYANSGLYSVEQAIETFASVYSHYNKCQQSSLFLSNVIRITSDEIIETKKKREENKERIQSQLEKEKEALIKKLERSSNEAEADYQQKYTAKMKAFAAAATVSYTSAELAAQEKHFRHTMAVEKDVNGRREDVHESAKSAMTNLNHTLFKEHNMSGIKNFFKDVKGFVEDVSELSDTKKQAEQASSDALIATIRDSFESTIAYAQSLLECQSRVFWTEKTEQLKIQLSQIIANSTVLSDEKRSQLSGIIFEYQKPVFDTSADTIFVKAAFLHRFFGKTNRLKIDKLTDKYNSELKKWISEIYDSIEESHANSFDTWMNNLLTTITDNIVEFNPQLHEKDEIIREETEKIKELEARMIKLNDYTEEIRKMMDWKES